MTGQVLVFSISAKQVPIGFLKPTILSHVKRYRVLAEKRIYPSLILPCLAALWVKAVDTKCAIYPSLILPYHAALWVKAVDTKCVCLQLYHGTLIGQVRVDICSY